MMINKRLINSVPESKKYIAANVAFQWGGLLCNIVLMTIIAGLLASLFYGAITPKLLLLDFGGVILMIALRAFCTIQASKMSFRSSEQVKKVLRRQIYEKLLRLGPSYKEKAATSEIVQVSVDGVDQLETYFGAYLPQFFYAMLAPLTLFLCLSFVNLPAALVLLVCVPLIPVAIALVQTWAKKLLGKYWSEYTTLGDVFLENLQGLTTLKIYQTDGMKNDEMNAQAEKFRKITMKVLSMQLNSITIMDFIAYGGAALGVIMAATQLQSGNVTLYGAFLIILLAADFFLPMRQLGSFFHVAMNGMAASDKIFKLLDLPEKEEKTETYPVGQNLVLEDVTFSYTPDKEVLKHINMEFPAGSFISIVGESGSGKSTIASLLAGKNQEYTGQVKAGNVQIKDIAQDSLVKNLTYVPFQSYLFAGTVRDNLLAAKPNATDQELWSMLEKVQLADFLKEEQGLDTLINNAGENISGGQNQRLALARALLADSPVYIFDEATSSIDVFSENKIVEELQQMPDKTVIMITHRLENARKSDWIYVLENGELKESGTHDQLIKNNSTYNHLWNTQQSLENYTRKGEMI